MKPWSFEGQQFVPSEKSKEAIIKNRQIEDYLSYSEGRETKFFLIAPKGLGKTLLLRYKSYLLHQKPGLGFKTNLGGSELTENLNIFHPDLSKDQLLQFSSLQSWKNVWKFCLTVVSVRTYGLSINAQLSKQLGATDRVSSVLTHLLTNRAILSDLFNFLPELNDQLVQIQSGVALFIDNVDQQFADLLTEQHYSDYFKEDEQLPAVKAWINAQIGLMAAIYDLHQSNHHLKIYATFRSEAFNSYWGQMRQNYLAYSVELKYSKEQLRKIFEHNIKMMPQEELFNPKGSSLISKFVGFDSIQHPFINDGQGKLTDEDVFEFIYRHTYGRPREIVRMGSYLLNDVINREEYRTQSYKEQIHELRRRVNEVGGDIFKEYQDEIIPKFDKEELRQFISSAKKNVISADEITVIEKRTAKFYYSLGLLGYVGVVDMTRGCAVQIFQTAASYNYSNLSHLPHADYYVVHPSLSEAMSLRHGRIGVFDEQNIIGNGLPFNVPENDKKLTLKNMVGEFYPTLPGNRLDAPGYAFPNDPIGKFMETFFTSDQEIIKVLRKQFPKKFHEKLTEIAIVHGLSKLNAHHQKRMAYAETLNRVDSPIKRSYQKKLLNVQSISDLTHFSHVLFGRTVTLGCFLFLDIPCNGIHHLLTKGKYEECPDANDDTAVQYLRKSFFINKYPNGEDGVTTHQEVTEHKREVFLFLSGFERQLLLGWNEHFSEMVKTLDWLPSPQQAFFEKQLLDTSWSVA